MPLKNDQVMAYVAGDGKGNSRFVVHPDAVNYAKENPHGLFNIIMSSLVAVGKDHDEGKLTCQQLAVATATIVDGCSNLISAIEMERVAEIGPHPLVPGKEPN